MSVTAAAGARGLVILDRDGVLNAMVVDAEHGTVDGPLHPSQVKLIAGAADSVRRLHAAGYQCRIATNQPSAAKGNTTMANIDATHARILELIAAEGGVIDSSHICRHKREDGCSCRKPNTGLLEEALERAQLTPEMRRLSWMVGDGLTDVEAGQRMELNTCYLGPERCDHIKAAEERGLRPTKFFPSLKHFTDWLLTEARP